MSTRRSGGWGTVQIYILFNVNNHNILNWSNLKKSHDHLFLLLTEALSCSQAGFEEPVSASFEEPVSVDGVLHRCNEPTPACRALYDPAQDVQ